MNPSAEKAVVNLDSPDAIRYWTLEMKATEEQLRTAIGQVGNDPDAVRQHLAGGNA